MADHGTTPIRSFRVCFKVERRLHKIDRWQIPIPFGIPLRGLGYAVAFALAVLVVRKLPLLGPAVWALPVPIRFILLPIGAAYALTQWEIDGRHAHSTAMGWMRFAVAPKRLAAFRPVPTPGPECLATVTIAHDEQSASIRRAVIRGPAEIVLRYPFTTRARRRTLRVIPQDGPPQWRGKQIRVKDRQRVVIT